jgi:hypothetical protein
LERLAVVGADPLSLMRRFEAEADVSAKRALLIALGEFPTESLAAGGREPFGSRLLDLYREHPDSGLHSAIDWLLRQKWGKAKELAAIDAELAAATRARAAVRGVPGAVPVGTLPVPVGPLLPAPAVAEKQDWFVNGEGQTFAVVRGPVEFTLGSSAPSSTIWRKLSFGTQSAAGSRFVERMLTVIETCRRAGRNAFAWLTDTVAAHFRRDAAPPLLAAA